MSRTCQTENLEALVRGELTPLVTHELEMHAKLCARCGHELSWLKTEATLFNHRVANDEVRRLWAAATPSRRRWVSPLLALAAMVAITTAMWLKPLPQFGQSYADMSAAPQMSEPNCSMMEPGIGFSCGPTLLASYR